MSHSLQRGPIPAIILASTNEDIRNCGHCQPCCLDTNPEMDLTLGEMLQMASRDDPAVFATQTLWNCDAVIENRERCQEGINLVRVIEALRDEAKLRGYSNIKSIATLDSDT